MTSRFTFTLFVLFIIYGASGTACPMPLASMTGHAGDSTIKGFLAVEKYIPINGIDQWITIKGNPAKPAILFIHGGPGSPISPYSDNLYNTWEKDFIIIQWDQRGTGRTFGKDAPEELTPEYLQAHPLTLEQMTADGIAVTEYMTRTLGKQKLILFGSSWGSVLAVKMATQRPDLYYAYVGHSQVVDPADDRPLYDKVYQLARQKNDTQALAQLNAIGKPPYERARQTGQLLRVVKKYEKAHSTPAPVSWFVETPGYDNAKDAQDRELGDDYSFVYYTGDSQLGVPAMRPGIHLLRDNINFKIPVYLIQGAEDLLTPEQSTRAYFEAIKAPQKKYYLLPNAAHGFNQAVLDTQFKIFKRIRTT